MKRLLVLIIVVSSCSQPKTVDIQGHRGARGLYPENSIPGFIKAIDLGVTTLEMDLSVTKDSVLIVSHEPYFSHEFCADPTGKRIPKDSIVNIYEMTYEEVRAFDCGSLAHDRFPEQQKMSTYKPALNEVLVAVNQHLKTKNSPQVKFNIELKTRKDADNIFHPTPEVFSELVFEKLTSFEMLDVTTIQSFDFRMLQYFNKTYPEVELAVLIENPLHWEKNIDSLGFTPAIYSCNYQLLSPVNIEELQEAGMRVIPWTINQTQDMKKLLSWGVDGIITDYPDRAINLINSSNE